MPIFNDELELSLKFEKTGNCPDACRLDIVESIPTNLSYSEGIKSTPTHKAWTDLINSAQKSIRIASFYWTLRDKRGYPTSNEVRKTFAS